MKNRGIFSKMMTVGAVMLFLIVVLLGLLMLLRHHQNKMVISKAKEYFVGETGTYLDMSSSCRRTLVYDYSFWDDFVGAVAKSDQEWLEKYIGALNTSYNLSFVGVYDSTGGEIYQATSFGQKEDLALPKDFFQRLYTERFLDFFIYSSVGLYQVHAATIHPTSDPSHLQSSPQGFFLAAYLWDDVYLDSISSIVKGRARVDPVMISGDTQPESEDLNPNLFSTEHPLPGWDGNAVAVLHVFRQYLVVPILNTIAWFILGLVAVVVLILFSMFFLATRTWVKKPLDLVRKVLQHEDREALDKLKQASGEFAQLGSLMEVYFQNLDHLQAAKDQAERSNRIKAEFLSNMSHEIRTPINGLLGFSRLLNTPGLSDEDRDHYLSIINRNTEQLLRVTDDLLEISHLETKKVKVKPEETDINVLLRDTYAVYSLQNGPGKVEVRLTKQLDDSCRETMVDGSKLLKVLHNLLDNALKYTEKGFVEFGCAREKYLLRFFVKDTGIGIQKENLETIFDRFRQGDPTISSKYGGFGLGLAIVKENVHLLGGEVTIHSEPGKGTDISFTIPYQPVVHTASEEKQEEASLEQPLSDDAVQQETASQQPDVPSAQAALADAAASKTQKATAKTPPPPPVTGPYTLLVAEDEEVNFLLLRVMLLNINPEFAVLRAKDGSDAVEICRNNPDIDLILMDVKMPVMNGVDAARIIRQFRPDLPIVIQSAYTTPEIQSEAREVGCQDFVSKPINKELLNKVLNRLLAK